MRHPRRPDRPTSRTRRRRRVGFAHVAAATLVLFVVASVFGAGGQWTELDFWLAAAAVLLALAGPLRRLSRRRADRLQRRSRGRRRLRLRLRRPLRVRAERRDARHRAGPVDVPVDDANADLVGGHR